MPTMTRRRTPSPALRGRPLPENLRRQLVEHVKREGEVETCQALGIARSTLERSLSGLGLRTVTITAIEARLRAAGIPEPPDRAA